MRPGRGRPREEPAERLLDIGRDTERLRDEPASLEAHAHERDVGHGLSVRVEAHLPAGEIDPQPCQRRAQLAPSVRKP